jgi:hypothetical protein
MSRGFTDYIFVGGEHNGLIEKSIPVYINRPPPKKISFQSDYYFVEENDGNIHLIKLNSKKLSMNWHSYGIEIYEKEEKKNRHKPGTIYNFIEQRMIERCVAMTKKGLRCMKPALYGKEYCCITHKVDNNLKKS